MTLTTDTDTDPFLSDVCTVYVVPSVFGPTDSVTGL